MLERFSIIFGLLFPALLNASILDRVQHDGRDILYCDLLPLEPALASLVGDDFGIILTRLPGLSGALRYLGTKDQQVKGLWATLQAFGKKDSGLGMDNQNRSLAFGRFVSYQLRNTVAAKKLFVILPNQGSTFASISGQYDPPLRAILLRLNKPLGSDVDVWMLNFLRAFATASAQRLFLESAAINAVDTPKEASLEGRFQQIFSGDEESQQQKGLAYQKLFSEAFGIVSAWHQAVRWLNIAEQKVLEKELADLFRNNALAQHNNIDPSHARAWVEEEYFRFVKIWKSGMLASDISATDRALIRDLLE